MYKYKIILKKEINVSDFMLKEITRFFINFLNIKESDIEYNLDKKPQFIVIKTNKKISKLKEKDLTIFFKIFFGVNVEIELVK